MVRKTISDDEISIDDFLGSRRRSEVVKKPVGDFNIYDYIEPARKSKDVEEVTEDPILNDSVRSDKAAGKSANKTKSAPTPPTKRKSATTSKQSFEEYHKLYLQAPKINNGKPIFISDDLRERLYEVTIRLGGRKMSPSGFVENLLRHHMEIHGNDWERWLNK